MLSTSFHQSRRILEFSPIVGNSPVSGKSFFFLFDDDKIPRVTDFPTLHRTQKPSRSTGTISEEKSRVNNSGNLRPDPIPKGSFSLPASQPKNLPTRVVVVSLPVGFSDASPIINGTNAMPINVNLMIIFSLFACLSDNFHSRANRPIKSLLFDANTILIQISGPGVGVSTSRCSLFVFSTEKSFMSKRRGAGRRKLQFSVFITFPLSSTPIFICCCFHT